jgi:hypothetical protein
MRTHLLKGSALVYRAIQVDDIVIADVLPPPVLDVPPADGVNANVAAFWRSGAMQNDSGEFTLGHVFNIKSWTFYTLCSFCILLNVYLIALFVVIMYIKTYINR